MKVSRISFFLLFSLLVSSLTAQNRLDGLVTDIYETPLAFVNILINNDLTDGVTTGIDGRFSIARSTAISQLEFRYVGYENLVYTAPKDEIESLKIQLKIETVGIEEITVIAGENPAHRIIRKAVENRDLHNPEKQIGYRCNTYNKMIFDWLPDYENIEKIKKDSSVQKKRKGLLGKYQKKRTSRIDELSEQREEHFLFLMESITDRKYRKPKELQEEVLHNRVSGFNHPSFAAIANAVQPFSFYKEHLDIMDKSYLNPISPNSTSAYYFSVQDTLYAGKDSIYIVHFKPRKKKKFDALKGLLYINSRGYAIQNVIAEPDDPAFINLRIEQQYQLVNETNWFPEELNFELIAENYPDDLIGMKVSGKSYISNVKIDPEWEDKSFARDSWMLEKEAHLSTDSFWMASRPFPLSEKELRTYEVVDSVGTQKHFDQFLKGAEALISGKYPLGKVDFLVSHVLSLNEYEDVRLGGGFETNESFGKWFSVNAYVGYGIEDKAWKYGGGLKFHILPDEKLQFRYQYKDDLSQPASLFPIDNNIFSNRFYAERMSQVKAHQIALSGKGWSFLQFDLSLNKRNWQPGFDYQYGLEDNLSNTFSMTNLALYLRYAFGEQTVNVMGSRAATQTYFPILELSYSQGLKTLDGDFSFNRLSAAITQFFPVRRLGKISYRLETGLVKGNVPFHQLYTSNVVANDSWFIIIDNSFQTLTPYEFTSDRFAHFFFEYEMAAPIIKTTYFRPRISLMQNIGVGDLSKPQLHHDIPIKTMEKGHFETGLRLGDILRVPYMKIAYIGLGVGIYYRYGAYALEKTEDNFAFNFVIDFSF